MCALQPYRLHKGEILPWQARCLTVWPVANHRCAEFVDGDRFAACHCSTVPDLSGCGEPEPRSLWQGRPSHRSSHNICDGGEPRTQQEVGGNGLKYSSEINSL